jgi:hypothetical protein
MFNKKLLSLVVLVVAFFSFFKSEETRCTPGNVVLTGAIVSGVAVPAVYVIGEKLRKYRQFEELCCIIGGVPAYAAHNINPVYKSLYYYKGISKIASIVLLAGWGFTGFLALVSAAS